MEPDEARILEAVAAARAELRDLTLDERSAQSS
jgi:hypothetical protein